MRRRIAARSAIGSSPSTLTSPVGRGGQPFDHLQRRGLPGAVGAEQRGDRAGRHVEVDAADGLVRRGSLPVGPTQSADPHRRIGTWVLVHASRVTRLGACRVVPGFTNLSMTNVMPVRARTMGARTSIPAAAAGVAPTLHPARRAPASSDLIPREDPMSGMPAGPQPVSERDRSRRAGRVLCGACAPPPPPSRSCCPRPPPRRPPTGPGWMPRLPPDERAERLLVAMTLEEKVELMTGDQGEAPSAFYNAPIARLGIPELRMADAGGGIAPAAGSYRSRATARPPCRPASTWVRPGIPGRLARTPARSRRRPGRPGTQMLLGPGSDLARQPFWGRIGEGMSEDPVLTASMTTPYVREVQSEHGHREPQALRRLHPGGEPRQRPELHHRRACAARGLHLRPTPRRSRRPTSAR